MARDNSLEEKERRGRGEGEGGRGLAGAVNAFQPAGEAGRRRGGAVAVEWPMGGSGGGGMSEGRGTRGRVKVNTSARILKHIRWSKV
uniref:Uncharacterized protein n=1 Tax=Oryza sativa subsp. japonica TaxID=39947 RepID=Q6K794_ORYSJ|nr:hypothetical protein [Oryza sativa Japonica Group]